MPRATSDDPRVTDWVGIFFISIFPIFFFFLATCFDISQIPSLVFFSSRGAPLSYCVYQIERCPTTQRIHFQCFMIFAKRQRKHTLETKFPHYHWDIRRGSRAEAIAYCRKEDTRIEGPYEIFDVPSSIPFQEPVRTNGILFCVLFCLLSFFISRHSRKANF